MYKLHLYGGDKVKKGGNNQIYLAIFFLFVGVICMLVVEVIGMCYLLFNLEFEGIIC